MEKMDQAAFMKALLDTEKRRDFSHVTFVGNIALSDETWCKDRHCKDIGNTLPLGDELKFDDAIFEGDLWLGDITVERLSLEHVRAEGKLGIYRCDIGEINGSHSALGWVTISNATGRACRIDFSESTFDRGLMLKATPARSLVLTGIDSAETLFEEADYGRVKTNGGQLGRRQSLTLGELQKTG